VLTSGRPFEHKPVHELPREANSHPGAWDHGGRKLLRDEVVKGLVEVGERQVHRDAGDGVHGRRRRHGAGTAAPHGLPRQRHLPAPTHGRGIAGRRVGWGHITGTEVTVREAGVVLSHSPVLPAAPDTPWESRLYHVWDRIGPLRRHCVPTLPRGRGPRGRGSRRQSSARYSSTVRAAMAGQAKCSTAR
jgi:hypothetical protein